MRSPSIHVEVRGDERVGSQALTYAEYRFFAALARRRGGSARCHARVELRQRRRRACPDVVCTARVAIDRATPARIQAAGAHAYAAINRAVARLEGVLS